MVLSCIHFVWVWVNRWKEIDTFTKLKFQKYDFKFRVSASLLVKLLSILQLRSSLGACFASQCLDLVLLRNRQRSMWGCVLPSVWPALYLPRTPSAQYWSPEAGWGTGTGVQRFLNWMIIGLSGIFFYCIVYSSACRIVQMWNLANSYVGSRHMPLLSSFGTFRLQL